MKIADKCSQEEQPFCTQISQPQPPSLMDWKDENDMNGNKIINIDCVLYRL